MTTLNIIILVYCIVWLLFYYRLSSNPIGKGLPWPGLFIACAFWFPITLWVICRKSYNGIKKLVANV